MRVVRARPGPSVADFQRARLIASRGGIVGHSLSAVSADSELLPPADVVVFATGGVRAGSVEPVSPRVGPQANADRILAGGATGRDDALVLLPGYLGAQR